MKEVLSVKGVFERTRAREGDRAVSAREDKTVTNTLLERKQKLFLFPFFLVGAQLTAGLGVLVSLNTYSILLGASSLALVVSGSPPTRLSPNPRATTKKRPLYNKRDLPYNKRDLQSKRDLLNNPGATTPEVRSVAAAARVRHPHVNKIDLRPFFRSPPLR